MTHKPATDDHLFDCGECGRTFETLSESAVTAVCPHCHAHVLLLRGDERDEDTGGVANERR